MPRYGLRHVVSLCKSLTAAHLRCCTESTRIWLVDLVQRRNSNLPVCRVRGLIGMVVAVLVASLTKADVPDLVVETQSATRTRCHAIRTGDSPWRMGWRLCGTAAKVAIRARDARRSRDRAERRGREDHSRTNLARSQGCKLPVHSYQCCMTTTITTTHRHRALTHGFLLPSSHCHHQHTFLHRLGHNATLAYKPGELIFKRRTDLKERMCKRYIMCL